MMKKKLYLFLRMQMIIARTREIKRELALDVRIENLYTNSKSVHFLRYWYQSYYNICVHRSSFALLHFILRMDSN